MSATFERGQRFQYDGAAFLIQGNARERVTAVDETYGGTKEFALSELLEAWTEGRLLLAYAQGVGKKPNAGTAVETLPRVPDLSMVEGTLREEALRRYTLVRTVLTMAESEPIRWAIAKALKAMAADWEQIPDEKTVYRWVRVFWASGFDGRSLISRLKDRGKGKRLDERVQAIIGEAINKCYMKCPPDSVQATADHAEKLLKDAGLPVPDEKAMYMRVRRVVQNLSSYDVAVAQLGQKRADAMFKANGPTQRVKRILEVVEIDHTPLDILVLPDVPSNLEIPPETLWSMATRPYLTACRDKKTGLVLGWHVGFTPPSWESVMKCLRHAIIYKSPDFLKRECPDLQHDYPVYGIFERLRCDNGAEFRSTHLDDAAFLFRFVLDYCPVRTPWAKGMVEQGFRTINAYFQSMPGTTFANITERQGYNSVKNACISFSLLKQVLYKIFIDIEARRYSDKLLSTRIEAWEAESFYPRVPNNSLELVVFLGQAFDRTLSVKGIEFERITYFSDELANLRCALPNDQWKVKCKVDASDLRCIWVLDPRSESFIEVPAVDQEYATGLSLWNHRVIKRYARKQKGARAHADLVEAKAELRRMVEEQVTRRTGKRAESPQKVARFMSGDAPSQVHEAVEMEATHPEDDLLPDMAEVAANETASSCDDRQPTGGKAPAKRSRRPGKGKNKDQGLSGADSGSMVQDDDFDSVFDEFAVDR